MCGTRDPGGRPVALLALLLQLALAAALPLAHARDEAAAFTHHVHIQAESSSSACLPHNDIGCHTCRLRSVSDLLTDPGQTPAVPLVFTATETLTADLSEAGAPPFLGAFGPRAPPHA